MRLRNREEYREDRQNPPSGDTGGENLDAARGKARDLLAAGDEAISRALSGNSEAFLAANRQQGGQ